ncbi:MAG: family glycosyltransferase, partial [Phycisphaerales bacterium]|nr:family glycosyltransferase [Phycisphaerales bacterium]
MPRWAGWAVAVLAFAAIAPLLGRLELANGIEVIHAATVLEMRRPGGTWLTPTLNGTPRVKKPPLPAWVGALAVTDRTMAGVGSLDPTARAAAYDRLAWEIRWPALLAGCLAAAATFDLGRTIGGRRVGLAAAVVAVTSLLFLRFVRLASTDVHLFLWVAAADALLARAALRRQGWAVVAAGAAVGLAVMCKGPVAVLQTIVPLGAWAVMVRR